MGWTAPRTWVVGEVVTAAIQNTHVRDNERYLKGLDGVVTVESGVAIDNAGGDEYLLLPLLSTSEAATVLAAEGKVAFDEQTHRPKFYDGTAVIQLMNAAQLTIASQAQADLLYATSATAWTRLVKGGAQQVLRMNAGATAPEWVTFNQAEIATGSYTGDNTSNKSVAHGMTNTPKMVSIIQYDAFGNDGMATVISTFMITNISTYKFAVTAADGTNFYVGDSGNAPASMNRTSGVYKWAAIG